MKYYTLVTRHLSNKWLIEFGSFEKSEVIDEMDYIKRIDRIKKKDMKILVTGENQKEIDQEINKLNNRSK